MKGDWGSDMLETISEHWAFLMFAISVIVAASEARVRISRLERDVKENKESSAKEIKELQGIMRENFNTLNSDVKDILKELRR